MALLATLAVCLLSLSVLASAQPVSVSITTPQPNEVVGLAGAGWLIDLEIEAADLSGNAVISAPGWSAVFNNEQNKSTFHPGVSVHATGLVVLLSTTPNNGGSLLGPATNLAGLFQIAGVAVDPSGLHYYRTLWFLAGAGFGLGIPCTLTAFVVNGTAPLLADPATTPGIVSNVANSTFTLSGPVSDTAASSNFTGPSPADPTALQVVIFHPEPDIVVGVDGAGWAIDTLAAATSPQFNPLLSSGAGYFALFDNGTDSGIFRPGSNVAVPGLVVLVNTTQSVAGSLLQGPSTNLAGLFQMNGLLEAQVSPGVFLNIVWPAWAVGAPLFGLGPSTLQVFYLNDTAPLYFTGNPDAAPNRISNVAVVNFFIAAAGQGFVSSGGNGGSTVLGDPSFSGFHGQPAYQVHGIPGEVFNVLQADSLQVNALFSFLDQGDAMTSAQMLQTRRVNAAAQLPATQPWSHPGTYLTQLGVQLGSIAVHLQAGRYAQGLTATLLSNGTLDIGQTVRDGRLSVTQVSSHVLHVRHELVSLSVVNSDGFFNIEEAQLLSSTAFTQLDGLLGQSADPAWTAGHGDEFEQHMLLDYWVVAANSTLHTLFSHEFKTSKTQQTDSA